MKPANNAPIYASIYAELAEVVRTHGYALAIHGSLARDFDLIAIPWTEAAADPWDVAASITATFALTLSSPNGDEPPVQKPHGRRVFTFIFKWGTTALDLSFMPRAP
jgi:hypothetical protein